MSELIQLPAPEGRPDLLIIAGEHSGDQHAATLLRGLAQERPDLQVCALGGEALRSAGANVIFGLVDHSVVGFAEVLKNYGFFKQLFEAVVDWIREYRPRAVCFIDYPGFNLRLADRLVKEGIAAKAGGDIKLLYYISPQIWAWKGHRRFKMAQLLDSLAVIFPFEVDCYADTTLPVQFVGHPFVAADFNLGLSYAIDGPTLLLPGSRLTPVRRIFPVLIKAFLNFARNQPERRAVALYPSEAVRTLLEELLAAHPGAANKIELRPADAPTEASAVLTSSGTMSLKVALAGIPGCIVYRANLWTYLLARTLVKIPYLGIANILLDRPAYPEFLQGAAKPDILSRELTRLHATPAAATTATELRQLLGEDQSTAAPQWLAEALKEKK
ncbi:lipid-A-disaccharide synthase [Cerasicoccus arenae]|uniref:Lipid-A-disaccharide synthase n=1 Tax=Cerasicoccus arenae TaxID=424488 RepID=A0A8J3GEC9_9BACT|nr:lipid-A-disaccharide synthase [Cerasicoccus arenae]MBK1859124.1 lipid-A-disaccharide synthase [Cerasicoccus arenae]GHB97979.1 lipid-A-disaccharide synthase 1 [Cerasicoccus arenae]